MPFHHLPVQPKLVNKLAPNIVQPPSSEGDSEVDKEKEAQKIDSLADKAWKEKKAQEKIDDLAERVQVPWKGTHVLVVAHKELKGKVGRVVDVHFCKTSPSGLEIELEPAVYNPANPFKHRRVDYHQVVELEFVIPCFPPLTYLGVFRCGKKLYNYKRPTSDLFHPLPLKNGPYKRSVDYESLYTASEASCGKKPMSNPSEISSTPAWNSSSSTPAWDPSSSTPTWNPSSSTPTWNLPSSMPGASTSSVLSCTLSTSSASPKAIEEPALAPPLCPTPTPTPPAHVLLDPRLEGIKVAAKVTGDGRTNKPMTVWGAVVFGQRKIVHSVNKALKDLTGSSVILDVPNPTRHEGLLVVIKGEHTGTFVRRVTHEGKGDNCLAICRVVTRREGSADQVTATTLKMWAGNLASVVESKEKRTLNRDILKAERDAVRSRPR